MITACVADGDTAARLTLRGLLEAQGVQVLGEAENGLGALALAEELHPDLLLLETRLPDLEGTQVAAVLQHPEAPLLLFVSSSSERAVAAFEYGALDYLLKPVASERLAKALRQARERLAERQAFREAQQGGSGPGRLSPLPLLPIHDEYAISLIPIEDILCAVAHENQIFVHTKAERHRVSFTLAELVARLPKEEFMRIHLSCLVNLRAIRQLLFLGSRSYAVKLSNGQQLPVSRAHYTALRERLGLSV